jgi:hypothetical protein
LERKGNSIRRVGGLFACRGRRVEWKKGGLILKLSRRSVFRDKFIIPRLESLEEGKENDGRGLIEGLSFPL